MIVDEEVKFLLTQMFPRFPSEHCRVVYLSCRFLPEANLVDRAMETSNREKVTFVIDRSCAVVSPYS